MHLNVLCVQFVSSVDILQQGLEYRFGNFQTRGTVITIDVTRIFYRNYIRKLFTYTIAEFHHSICKTIVNTQTGEGNSRESSMYIAGRENGRKFYKQELQFVQQLVISKIDQIVCIFDNFRFNFRYIFFAERSQNIDNEKL